jgi:ABC-2 type transport system permease protein
MKTIKKCWHVALIGARSNYAYKNETFGRIFFLATMVFIFSRLWRVTYAQMNATTLGGLRMEEMLAYFVLAEAIILSRPNVNQIVDEEVRNGQLALHLIRPFPYPLYRLSTTFGERVPRFLMVLVIGGLFLKLFVGEFPLTLFGATLMVAAVPVAFALDFFACFLIGTLAFWCEDTSGIFLIYSRLVMILGGMLIPIELFPPAWQPVLHALPFSSMIYGPAHLALRPDWHAFGELLVSQTIAMLTVLAALVVVYRLALTRVSAQGG